MIERVAQFDFDLGDRATLTLGANYTEDEKDFQVLQFGQLWLDLEFLGFQAPSSSVAPISVSDDQTSWELSANFAATDDSSIYGRVASGFRAQTIQGRDIAFGHGLVQAYDALQYLNQTQE